MLLEFVAHACFRLTDSRGVRVVFDPYESGGFSGRVGYAPVAVDADVVVLTHDHLDHAYVEGVGGSPVVIRHEGAAHGIAVRSVPVAHDHFDGARFGGFIDLKVVEIDGLRVVHCGDLGQYLDRAQIAKIGPVDILIIPVGGFYTLDGDDAAVVTRALRPRWVVPCHYLAPGCGFDLEGPERFLRWFSSVWRVGGSAVRLEPGSEAQETTAVWLEMARAE